MKGKHIRILSLVLLAALLAGALNLPLPGLSPAAARAEDGFIIDGNGVLIHYSGPGGVVRIPNAVTEIGPGAFAGREDITVVVMPDTVRVIGVGAFQQCTGLERVVIPKGVAEIGNMSFRFCTALMAVAIPNTVRVIGNSAFQGCTGLKRVTLPKGVTEIGDRAFRDCTGLTGVAIPNTVKVIGVETFRDCTGLKKVTLPKGVAEIGAWAFSGCTSLTGVAIPNTVRVIGEAAFAGCTGLKKITLPKGVTEIGAWTFSECTSLTGVTIPNTVDVIGYAAFSNCISLKKITLPKGVTEIGSLAFFGCTSLTGITIPNTVDMIGMWAFSNCISLKKVTLPQGVTEIGQAAFYGCPGLTDIAIPSSVTSIGNRAFYGCTGLTSVVIPDSVTDIAEDAFDGCPNLRFAALPSEPQAPDFAGSAPATTVIPDNLLPPMIVLREGQRMVLPRFKGAKAEWSVAGEPVADIINNNVVRGVDLGEGILRMTVVQAAQGKALTLNGQPLKPGKAYDIGLRVLGKEEAAAGKLAVNGPKNLTLHPLGPAYGYPAAAKLGLTFTPAGLPEYWEDNCFYISGNPGAAQVLDDGTIVAVRPGKAVITAYTPNMKTAKVTVTVKGRVTSLNLKDENGNTVKKLPLNQGDTCQLTPEFNEDAALKAIHWTSSKPAVAIVYGDGLVMAQSRGTARITATALDGSNKKATVVVTVTEADAP